MGSNRGHFEWNDSNKEPVNAYHLRSDDEIMEIAGSKGELPILLF